MLIRLRVFIRSKEKNNNFLYKYLKKAKLSIPCVFTFLNAIFGFLSILKSFEANYKLAALYIALAALMDALDGRIARALNSSSYFGMELDSLSDAISFCLAPTVLLYSWLDSNNYLCIITVSTLAFYLCAGISRLARFNNINTININDQNSKNNTEFIGLPTPIAALFIVSFIFYYNYSSILINKSLIYFVINLISILMVSPVRFDSLKDYQIFKSVNILLLILFLVLIYYYNYLFFLLIFCLYVIYSIIKSFLSLKINHKQ